MSVTTLALAGILFIFFVVAFSIVPASRKPVWDQAGTIVVMVAYGIVLALLAIASPVGGSDRSSKLTYAASCMAAYYLGKLGAHYVCKWRHERWLHKQRQQELVESLLQELPLVTVADEPVDPQWLQLPPENGGGQPIKADPPKDLR